MHLDKFGLPVQADGDANDQLQRTAMIVAADTINGPLCNLQSWMIHFDWLALEGNGLQPQPGVYVRYNGGDSSNVSADQLVSALAAHVALKQTPHILRMFLRMVMRLGFAQNYKDGLSGQDRTKIPDFMLLRALPLFLRASACLYPLTVIADGLLVLSALASVGPVWRDDKGFSQRSPGDVDDNVTVLTLAVCRYRMSTPLSYLASRIYGRLRPFNLGCGELVKADGSFVRHHPVYGALRWYHRKESGGNPEIAEMYRGICKKYFE